MIIDTSALIAIVNREAEAQDFIMAALSASRLAISAGSWLEATVVTRRLHRPELERRLDQLFDELGVEIVPFDAEQAEIARQAYRDFGRGSGHPAQLNLGDCFAYALATVTREPLLFKGDDFPHTDLTSAVV